MPNNDKPNLSIAVTNIDPIETPGAPLSATDGNDLPKVIIETIDV